MALFEEPFTDPAKLNRDWIVAPGMAVGNGLLTFAPGHDEGYCVGVTRRTDFDDFSITGRATGSSWFPARSYRKPASGTGCGLSPVAMPSKFCSASRTVLCGTAHHGKISGTLTGRARWESGSMAAKRASTAPCGWKRWIRRYLKSAP